MAGLLAKWLAHYDPVHRGWTLRGIATGVCATNGFFFPRIRGGHHLRRAVGTVPGLDAVIVGAAPAGSGEVREFPWVVHPPGATCVYQLNAVGGGGVEEESDASTAIVEFDEAGRWIGCRPGSPGDLRVRALAGGRFELRWSYPIDGPAARPSEFRVYSDGGSGEVDYSSVVGRVGFRFGRIHYRFVSPAHAHGLRVVWVVRAAGAAEDLNASAVAAWADSQGPLCAETFVVEAVEGLA